MSHLWIQSPPQFREDRQPGAPTLVIEPHEDSEHGAYILAWEERGFRGTRHWLRRFEVVDYTTVSLVRSMAAREVSGGYACTALETLFFSRVYATDDGLAWLHCTAPERAGTAFQFVVDSWDEMLLYCQPNGIISAAVAAAKVDLQKGFELFLENVEGTYLYEIRQSERNIQTHERAGRQSFSERARRQ